MIKAIRHLSIFKRLLFSSLVVILIPSVIIGLFAYAKFSAEMDATASKYTHDMLRNIDSRISVILKEYDDLSYSLSINTELKNLLRKCRDLKSSIPMNDAQKEEYESCQKRIGNILYEASLRRPYIENLEIISMNDEFTQIDFAGENEGARLVAPDTLRATSWYGKAVNSLNRPVWWNTTKEIMTFKSLKYPNGYIGNCITLLRSIPEPRADPLGVIAVNVSANALYQRVGVIEARAKGENLILLSQEGMICYFSPAFGFVTLDDDVIGDIIRKDDGSFIRNIARSENLVTVFRSEYTGWHLCSVIPRKNLLKSIYDIRDLIIIISALCVLAAFVMAYLVTVSISRPLKKLKNTIEKVDEKNIDIAYHDDIHDEVGVLGQRFNYMIKRIRNLINTVYEAELAKKEEMLLRKEAELDALQMQINPHFLYNTLDMIRWQVMSEEKSGGKGSNMISAFSELLRAGTKTASSLTDVREEIDHVKRYVEVVRFDLEYDLTVRYEIEEEAYSLKIPKFSLQPLVENAIVHGFKHRKGSAEILISIRIEDKDLMVEVMDNGEGIPEDMSEEIQTNLNDYRSKSKYIGLKNVNRRIKLYFGEQYGLRVISRQGEYTKIVLHIPASAG